MSIEKNTGSNAVNNQLVALIRAGENEADNMLKLWNRNKGFVFKTAKKYSGYAEMDDLMQEGYLGLCEAVRYYDAEKGVPFINYAALWIRQVMQRYIDNTGNVVRIPVYLGDLVKRYKKLNNEYFKYYGMKPTDREMSSFLGVKGYAISTWSNEHDLAEQFLQFINQPKYAKVRYQKTQEIPPIKSVMADPIITNDDFANAIAVQASRAVPIPSIPEMSEVWGPFDGALDVAISGKDNVKDALKSAVEHIDYQIEAFRSGL